MQTETDLILLEVPILQDDTVSALHEVLLDLLCQFENHYGHQLRRQWQKLDAKTRDPLKPWQRLMPPSLDPDAALDDELNDDLPF